MKTDTMLIIGGIALGAIVLSKGKIGQGVGESVGAAVAGIPFGIVKGTAVATKTYIAEANAAGKKNPLHLSNLSWSVWEAGQSFKKLGNNKSWWY